jgi:hypothetical protein
MCHNKMPPLRAGLSPHLGLPPIIYEDWQCMVCKFYKTRVWFEGSWGLEIHWSSTHMALLKHRLRDNQGATVERMSQSPGLGLGSCTSSGSCCLGLQVVVPGSRKMESGSILPERLCGAWFWPHCCVELHNFQNKPACHRSSDHLRLQRRKKAHPALGHGLGD